MTEQEWMVCDEWSRMLRVLPSRWTARQANLYLCSGLRQIWYLLYHVASREIVEMVERAVDQNATQAELEYAVWAAEVPTFGYDFEPEDLRAEDRNPDKRSEEIRRLLEMGVYNEEDIQNGRLSDLQLAVAVKNAAHIAYHIAYHLGSNYEGEIDDHELEHIGREDGWPKGWLVREIAGNPFRPQAMQSCWITPDVDALASAAYEERTLPNGHLDPDRLAVLSDALEEAGCTDAAILDHLRSPGPHVRGCWALDIILGKR